MPPPASGTELLPDSLLGLIFSVAGREAGDAITLVSKRWRRVFYSEPSIWQGVALTSESLVVAYNEGQAAQWFQCQARLLQQIGGLVQQLEYSQVLPSPDDYGYQHPDRVDMEPLATEVGTSWWLSSVLACLNPASLRSLIVSDAPLDAPAAAVLGGMSSLTQLQIKGRDRLSRCATAALQQLQQLRRLELAGDSIPRGLPAALQRLTQLTGLGCYSSRCLPGLTAIHSLTQLRQLQWHEQRRSGSLRVDAQQLLARLPHLEQWRFSSQPRWRGPGKLEVGNAALQMYGGKRCSRQGGAIEHVQLAGLLHVASLQQLVDAGLLGGSQPSQLRGLTLYDSELSRAALFGCHFLGHLTELTLAGCTFPHRPDDEADPVLDALLQLAPRLQSLSLLACFKDQPFPAALVRCTGLKHLGLQNNGLDYLPLGPYLSSLQSLDLHANFLTRLPPALRAATSLTGLSLAGNFGLALTTADVEGVLLRLPRLSRLSLGITHTPAPVLWRMFAAAPQLQVTESPAAAMAAAAGQRALPE